MFYCGFSFFIEKTILLEFIKKISLHLEMQKLCFTLDSELQICFPN